MRAKCALIGLYLAGEALFAADALGVREYSERCVRYFAQIYDVSPALVRAVIQVESAWQPGVVSSNGAMGLMQLMPVTAEHFGVAHPFFIDENIRGGVAYLAELKHLFPGDRSSFEVITTNGLLLAFIVPSFGMLICHSLRISSSSASNS